MFIKIFGFVCIGFVALSIGFHVWRMFKTKRKSNSINVTFTKDDLDLIFRSLNSTLYSIFAELDGFEDYEDYPDAFDRYTAYSKLYDYISNIYYKEM